MGLVSVPVEHLQQPSIERIEHVFCFETIKTWMDPIVDYLTTSRLPEDQEEARRIRNNSARYTMVNEKLYWRGHLALYQWCIGPSEAKHLMKEIHNGECGNHFGGKALSFKSLLQGYY